MLYPISMAAQVNLGVNDEPLLSLIFSFTDTEDVEMVLTEDELVGALGVAWEARMRAAVLRELLTMFPEQRDAILANVLFRWTGEIGEVDGP